MAKRLFQGLITYLLLVLGVALMLIAGYVSFSESLPFQNQWLDVSIFLFGLFLICLAGMRISEVHRHS